MKWPVIGLLLTGVAAAFFAALLVASIGFGDKKPVAPSETTVLVAKEDMTPLSVVTQDSFTRRSVISTRVPAGALGDPVQVVGRVLSRNIRAGEALTEQSLAPAGNGVDVAGRLEPGMRAVTVAMSNYAGLEGLLYPGSLVDVIANFRMMGTDGSAVSTTLLENVLVLAVNEEIVGADKPKEDAKDKQKEGVVPTRAATSPRRARHVTLNVNSEQAKALQLALEFGSITLAMRNPNDTTQVQEDPTLLNAGRLAKLADFLPSQVGGRQVAENAEDEAALTAAAIPTVAPTHAEPREWEVLVVRGVKVETQKFQMPKEAAPR